MCGYLPHPHTLEAVSEAGLSSSDHLLGGQTLHYLPERIL
jgi:hypothetical protein